MASSYIKQMGFMPHSLFEELCSQIIKSQCPKSRRPDGAGGDNGVDMYEGELGEQRRGSLHIWQIKHYAGRLSEKGRKKEIEKFLKKANDSYKPDKWT